MMRILLYVIILAVLWWFVSDKIAQIRLYLRYDLFWWMFPY